MKVFGYATQSPTSKLAPHSFERREPRADDVVVEILYCGVCHSDLHMARNDWGWSFYPLVPGHEIIGRVSSVGSSVTRLKQAIMLALVAWSIHVDIVALVNMG